MGKAQYLLGKALRGEEADIQKKAKKRGLWGKIGMGLGGLLAMGLTAGTAAPLVAGLMSAGGTYVGGKLGDILARQWGGARIKGKGRFFKGEREGIVKSLGEEITAGALKSGLTAGMMQLGAGLQFGKEGLSLSGPGTGVEYTKAGGVTKTSGFKFGDIFKPKGGFTKDTLMGRIGETLDPKMGESFIGKGLKGLKERALAKSVTAAGKEAKLGEFLGRETDFAAEFGEGGGDPLGLQRMRVSSPAPYYSGDRPTLQDIREYDITPTDPIEAFTQQMPISEEILALDQKTIFEPTSYGPGISGEILGDPSGSSLYDAYGGFTRGESFPVTSPNLVEDIGGAYTQSPAYDYKTASAEKAGEISWQKRILGI